MRDGITFPAYQLDTFAKWQTVPLAAEQCGIPERRLHWWIDHDIVPRLLWCGMKIVRLKDVRLAVASPPKRGRPARRTPGEEC